MVSIEEAVSLPLDPEWVDLMKTAREMGITPEEVRSFLVQASLELSGFKS
ncbi:anti-repressor SinI family protein [Effusibacillus lacus]|uniref:Sin domain-containing protein n=1 Tax=Effusibacillus lacus TaxID=1348429 RepID=A0A292YJP3_9BACL|nr:anti-repressor SinI family protein [Effusibacillus lacus]TCS70827.1 anti-repressor SinI [Effusibacillus lacus]GAX89376.1 hypothetical protein EFBL_0994 [Effusibacillus lacus]